MCLDTLTCLTCPGLGVSFGRPDLPCHSGSARAVLDGQTSGTTREDLDPEYQYASHQLSGGEGGVYFVGTILFVSLTVFSPASPLCLWSLCRPDPGEMGVLTKR